MTQIFEKENIIQSFMVENDKVFTTIDLNGFNITNPTLEQFKSIGWKEHVPKVQVQEPYLPTLEELVEQKIRESYSINQEFEVQRKRDVEPEAFQAYYDYVEECITWAHEQDYKEKE